MKIGIIGGSGLDDPQFFTPTLEKEVLTPFGAPSSSLKIGLVNGVDIVFLARHGSKHTLMPTNVNYRANIWALKEEGCTHILASTACGSLREHIHPGDFIFIDQFIDRTTKRLQSFYNDPCYVPFSHLICHLPMADPFCAFLRSTLAEAAGELNLRYHDHGTMVTIEGPRFSSRAESEFFRNVGGDVINMSTIPEAVLAREVGICYAAIAMATDYDCWRSSGEAVSLELVLEVFRNNISKLLSLLSLTFSKISLESNSCSTSCKSCICDTALDHAILGLKPSPFKPSPFLPLPPTGASFDIQALKERIRTIPHFPKQGVMFRDITTLLKDREAFAIVVEHLAERYRGVPLKNIVGIESRGFILGAALACRLKLGFVPLRKQGKLPAETDAVEYSLEYGTGRLEIHTDALEPGHSVVIVDDLIATGGTLRAAIQLVERRGAHVHECAALIDLPDLQWRQHLSGYPVYTLMSFEGH